MAASVRVVQLCLLLLSLSSYYFIWHLCLNNGTVRQMRALRETGLDFPLTNTNATYVRDYTGVKAIDEQFVVLVCVFWEIIDGSMPGAALHAFDFGGQGASAWPLMVIEWMRMGNRGSMLSYVFVWGLALQNFSFALVVPVVLALHLSLSPTLRPTGLDIVTDVSETGSVILSITGGYIIPAILMSLPAPAVITYDQKQLFMSLWQIFPLNVSVLQQIFKRCGKFVFPQSTRNTRSNALAALRATYAFSFSVTAAVRIAALSISFFSLLFPSMMAPEHAHELHPWAVFVPAAVTPEFQVSSIGQGIHMLFQYDEIIGSAALLLWASTMYVQAGKTKRSLLGWLKLSCGITAASIFSGPCGAALALMWARDEAVLGSSMVEAKKVQ